MRIGLVMLVLLTSCEEHNVPPADPGINATAPSLPPPGWQGMGILQQDNIELPPGVPEWAKIRAQVIERNGQRLLVTTGRSARIQNPGLLRTSAEARARAELARWLGSERLVGSVIVDAHVDSDRGEAYALAELPVSADWIPGATVR